MGNNLRPLNWSNKLQEWIIFSLKERFYLNKTDVDITNKLKKDIIDINMKKNQATNKFKIFFDVIKSKIQFNKFD